MTWKSEEDEVERNEDGSLAIDEKRQYKNSQLEAMADAMLRDYSKEELCVECLEDGNEDEGEETGKIVAIPQWNNGEAVVDGSGNQLVLDFPEMSCKQGHIWYYGEGKARGHAGRNPILLEEHLIQRKRREIYNSEGVPDPNIVSGIYFRVHPQGRKVNTDKQRKQHGASFYR